MNAPSGPDAAGASSGFVEALDAAFDASEPELRVVARHARDLADSGRYRADTSRQLTPAVVVDNLRDAPDDRLASRWNWWVGSLELAFGDYAEFQVRSVRRE